MTAKYLSHSELQKAVAELERKMHEAQMQLYHRAGPEDFMGQLAEQHERGYRDGIAEALDLLANPTKYRPPADHLLDKRVDSIQMTHEGTILVYTKPGWSWRFENDEIEHELEFDTTEDLADGLDHLEKCRCGYCTSLLAKAKQTPLAN